MAKPHLLIFKSACKLAGKAPNACYYVGDDLVNDILVCEKANMRGAPCLAAEV